MGGAFFGGPRGPGFGPPPPPGRGCGCCGPICCALGVLSLAVIGGVTALLCAIF